MNGEIRIPLFRHRLVDQPFRGFGDEGEQGWRSSKEHAQAKDCGGDSLSVAFRNFSVGGEEEEQFQQELVWAKAWFQETETLFST